MTVPDAVASGEPQALVSLAQTDSAGHYRLENVPPGRYYIAAGFIAFPTYYPGVTAQSSAVALQVTAGATLTGKDFSSVAPSSIGGSLSGHVVQNSITLPSVVML